VKAAGISKTTLYSRFDSKEALFRAIMDRLNDRAAGMASLRPLPDTLDLEQGLESFANRMLELSLSGDLRDVNRLIYSESQRFPELGVAAAERMQLGVETVSRFIRECADAEQRRIRDPDCVAEAFVLMIRGWYVNVMLMGRDVSKSERERWVECAVHAMVSDWSDW
jgi:AcrR family transcriptional regulator